MRYELVRYEGVEPARETVVQDSTDADELYARRDLLNAESSNLARLRHGVRPAKEAK